MVEVNGVWSELARSWAAIGAPQRPSPDDMAIFLELVRATLSHDLPASSGFNSPVPHRVCVLGVTPELVQVDWPAGTIIEAFDKSVDMVTRHWAEHPALPSRVLQAEWHDLPVEDAHFEMIVGDGCTTQFPNSAYYSSFFQEMHRVLQPGGALVMRCFLSPESPLTEDIIMRQVKDRQVRHFGALKWQIAMMLTDLKSTQVKVHEVFATFDRLFPVRESLAVEMGWTKAEIDTIDTYRDQESVYTFPTFGTFAQLCRPHFAIHSVRQGAYELADCCPILTLNPVQLDRPGT